MYDGRQLLEQAKNRYKPKLNARFMEIPRTIDKEAESRYNTRLVWLQIILGAVVLIALEIVFMRLHWFFLIKIFMFFFLIFLYLCFINFIALRGAEARDAYLEAMDNDFKLSESLLWSILDIEPTYPYISHMGGTRRAIFVRLNKDVKEGKRKNSVDDHFDAIADMYQTASEEGLTVIHLDYMDNIGEDNRVEDFLNVSERIENVDYQTMLMRIFRNLEYITKDMFSTFDVYMFISSNPRDNLLFKVRRVMQHALRANYKTYTVLNRDEIRKIPSILYNLHAFSANQAQQDLFQMGENSNIRLIKVVDLSTGEEQNYNIPTKKMREERERLLEERRKAKDNARKAKGKSKVSKQTKPDSRVVDLDNRDMLDGLSDATQVLIDEDSKAENSKSYELDEDEIVLSKELTSKDSGKGYSESPHTNNKDKDYDL